MKIIVRLPWGLGGVEAEDDPFVESEQIWALSRKILLYGPERPLTAQVFIKKEILVDE